MMIEGRWDTWSYADLMDPEMFHEILLRDSFNQKHLSMPQRQYKWLHIIQPLCAALGYELMSKEDTSYFPADGD
eukprot:1980128-Amphidinium_carterae.1